MARTRVRGSRQLNAQFLDLTDTPVEYGTSSGFLTVVNTAGTAIEFKDKNEILPPVNWYNQIFTSDGNQKVYTLTAVPEVESVLITLEGMALSYGAGNDYTISGDTLTLTAGVDLEAGMKIDVNYVSKDATATTGILEFGSVPADQQVKGLSTTLQVDVNSVGFGAVLHIDDDGNLIESDADATSVIPCQFLAAEAGTGMKRVLINGVAKDSVNWSWTPGGALYVSTTTGEMTQTAPDQTGDRVQIVGYAISSDTIFFKPDWTDLEIK